MTNKIETERRDGLFVNNGLVLHNSLNLRRISDDGFLANWIKHLEQSDLYLKGASRKHASFV